MKFLKSFGLGLGTIILLPFFLIVIGIIAIYGVVVYFVELVRHLIRFFKGEKGPLKLAEDKQVLAIKETNMRKQMGEDVSKQETPAPVPPAPTKVYVQQNYYSSLNSNAYNGAPNIPFDSFENPPQNPNNLANPSSIPNIPYGQSSVGTPQIEQQEPIDVSAQERKDS